MKQPPTRTFKLFVVPHVADPELLSPVHELYEDGTVGSYSGTDIVRRACDSIDHAQVRQAGYSEGVEFALMMLGVTREQWEARLRA